MVLHLCLIAVILLKLSKSQEHKLGKATASYKNIPNFLMHQTQDEIYLTHTLWSGLHACFLKQVHMKSAELIHSG